MNIYSQTSIPHVQTMNLSTPLYAQFEVSGTCDDKCIMCYNVWHGKFKIPGLLTREQHFEVLKILNPHIFSIIFSGGEPTDTPWLPELIEYCSKCNVDSSLISHGKNIDDDLARRLAGAGLQGAQISLHHYKDEVSDWITGTEGSIGKTLRGIHNMLKYLTPESIGICMVVNHKTAEDVFEMGSFLADEGVKIFAVSMLSYSGRAVKAGFLPTKKQLHQVYTQLETVHKEFDLKVGFTGGMPFCVLPKGYEESPVEFHNTCDAAINQVVISPNGTCRPCVEYPQSGGHILKKPLEDIWQSDVFRRIRMFHNVPEGCVSCTHISTCHGGCRAAAINFTGSDIGLDPLMCEVNQ